jgi:hypothetical protein
MSDGQSQPPSGNEGEVGGLSERLGFVLQRERERCNVNWHAR